MSIHHHGNWKRPEYMKARKAYLKTLNDGWTDQAMLFKFLKGKQWCLRDWSPQRPGVVVLGLASMEVHFQDPALINGQASTYVILRGDFVGMQGHTFTPYISRRPYVALNGPRLTGATASSFNPEDFYSSMLSSLRAYLDEVSADACDTRKKLAESENTSVLLEGQINCLT